MSSDEQMSEHVCNGGRTGYNATTSASADQGYLVLSCLEGPGCHARHEFPPACESRHEFPPACDAGGIRAYRELVTAPGLTQGQGLSGHCLRRTSRLDRTPAHCADPCPRRRCPRRRLPPGISGESPSSSTDANSKAGCRGDIALGTVRLFSCSRGGRAAWGTSAGRCSSTISGHGHRVIFSDLKSAEDALWCQWKM
jgi:hypothetical protein